MEMQFIGQDYSKKSFYKWLCSGVVSNCGKMKQLFYPSDTLGTMSLGMQGFLGFMLCLTVSSAQGPLSLLRGWSEHKAPLTALEGGT